MDISSLKQKVEDRINEHDAGHIVEYTKADGSTGVYNKLDLDVARHFKNASIQEKDQRVESHTSSVITLTLVLVIALIILVIFYIKTNTDITGIYYDNKGVKIKVYHNKFFGTIEINNNGVISKGLIKKNNDQFLSIYLDKDSSHNIMTRAVSATVDVYERSIIWGSSTWYADKNCFAT